ncbi:MAG: hypothetical protein KDA65_02875 [Planctomycetaceae bacterium]|nr:hypothetical protein [Planctomycetaceae bacterium]
MFRKKKFWFISLLFLCLCGSMVLFFHHKQLEYLRKTFEQRSNVYVSRSDQAMLPQSIARKFGRFYPRWLFQTEVHKLTVSNSEDLRTAFELYSMEHLNELRIGGGYGIHGNRYESDIGDADLTALPALPELRLLKVIGTNVTDESLAAIGRFTAITDLEIHHNAGITGSGYTELKDLKELKRFIYNHDTDEEPLWLLICELPELEKIHQFHQRAPQHLVLTDEHLSHLHQDLNLTEIPFRNYEFTDQGLQQLHYLKQVRQLDLHGTSITDTGLKGLTSTERLSKIDLSDTAVTDAGIEALSRIRSLSSVKLSGPQITDACFEHLKRLPHLREVILTQCAINGTGLIHVAGQPKLEVLVINECPLSPEGYVALGKLDSLKILNLKNMAPFQAEDLRALNFKTSCFVSLQKNTFSDEAFRALCDIPNINSLQLINCSVPADSLAHLENMKDCRRLILTGIPLSDTGLAGLAKAPALEDLNLSHTNLDDHHLQALYLPAKLNRLVAHETEITDVGLKNLADSPIAPQLEWLTLSNTTINLKEIETLNQFTLLRSLDLENTKISDDSIPVLTTLPNIRSIDLQGTRVTEKGVQKMRAALPNVSITYDKPVNRNR